MPFFFKHAHAQRIEMKLHLMKHTYTYAKLSKMDAVVTTAGPLILFETAILSSKLATSKPLKLPLRHTFSHIYSELCSVTTSLLCRIRLTSEPVLAFTSH